VEFVEIFKLVVVREENRANLHMIFLKSTPSGRSQKTTSQGNDKEMKLGKEKVSTPPLHLLPPISVSIPTNLTSIMAAIMAVIMTIIMTLFITLRINNKYRRSTNQMKVR